MPPAWKGPGGIIVKWFTAVEFELSERLQHGCGRRLDWASVLGSKKRLRRKLDTFHIKLTLHQIRYSMQMVPPVVPIYTKQGDGRSYLVSAPPSPGAKVLGPSSDTLEAESEDPSHVSYHALLQSEGTEAETSDWDLDLFPGLATTIRY